MKLKENTNPISKVDEIFQIFSDNNSNPQTELKYKNNFTLSVSVILSAQATDISVNKATKNLYEKYDTPEKMLSLGMDGLKNFIKTINFYNNKARNVIGFSRILIEKHESNVPNNFEELIKLPGIGRKTANVILNCAFGIGTMPVDTHVHRVSNRIGLSHGSTPDKVEYDLMNIVPKKWLGNAHHWLVLHGRYVCKARKALCEICNINKYCKYYNATR